MTSPQYPGQSYTSNYQRQQFDIPEIDLNANNQNLNVALGGFNPQNFIMSPTERFKYLQSPQNDKAVTTGVTPRSAFDDFDRKQFDFSQTNLLQSHTLFNDQNTSSYAPSNQSKLHSNQSTVYDDQYQNQNANNSQFEFLEIQNLPLKSPQRNTLQVINNFFNDRTSEPSGKYMDIYYQNQNPSANSNTNIINTSNINNGNSTGVNSKRSPSPNTPTSNTKLFFCATPQSTLLGYMDKSDLASIAATSNQTTKTNFHGSTLNHKDMNRPSVSDNSEFPSGKKEFSNDAHYTNSSASKNTSSHNNLSSLGKTANNSLHTQATISASQQNHINHLCTTLKQNLYSLPLSNGTLNLGNNGSSALTSLNSNERDCLTSKSKVNSNTNNHNTYNQENFFTRENSNSSSGGGVHLETRFNQTMKVESNANSQTGFYQDNQSLEKRKSADLNSSLEQYSGSQTPAAGTFASTASPSKEDFFHQYYKMKQAQLNPHQPWNKSGNDITQGASELETQVAQQPIFDQRQSLQAHQQEFGAALFNKQNYNSTSIGIDLSSKLYVKKSMNNVQSTAVSNKNIGGSSGCISNSNSNSGNVFSKQNTIKTQRNNSQINPFRKNQFEKTMDNFQDNLRSKLKYYDKMAVTTNCVNASDYNNQSSDKISAGGNTLGDRNDFSLAFSRPTGKTISATPGTTSSALTLNTITGKSPQNASSTSFTNYQIQNNLKHHQQFISQVTEEYSHLLKNHSPNKTDLYFNLKDLERSQKQEFGLNNVTSPQPLVSENYGSNSHDAFSPHSNQILKQFDLMIRNQFKNYPQDRSYSKNGNQSLSPNSRNMTNYATSLPGTCINLKNSTQSNEFFQSNHGTSKSFTNDQMLRTPKSSSHTYNNLGNHNANNHREKSSGDVPVTTINGIVAAAASSTAVSNTASNHLTSENLMNNKSPQYYENQVTVDFSSNQAASPMSNTVGKGFFQQQEGKVNYDKNIESYNLGKILGLGSYAVVRIAVYRGNNNKVAIQTYEQKKLTDPQKKQNVSREIKILSKLKCENIIRLHQVIDGETQVHLVMEYFSSTPLNSFIKNKSQKYIFEDEAQIIIYQIAVALKYCHRKCVVHRDLQLENILIDQNQLVQLIDFGFSIAIAPETKLNIFCGTPSYMAPEIVNQKQYSFGVDVWALGILVFKVLTGNFPFKGVDDKELFKQINNCKLEFPSFLSNSARSLITKILQVNPKQRAPIDQIIQHQWFAGVSSGQK